MVSQLIDEGLPEEAILTVIDAPPETDRYGGVTHHVADFEVWDRIGHILLEESAHHFNILSVFQTIRRQPDENGGTTHAYSPAEEVTVSIESGSLSGQHHRPIIVVPHILITRPDHLHRPIDLLRNECRHACPVLREPPSAKATPEMVLMDDHLSEIEPEHFGHVTQCPFTILRWCPNLRMSRRDMRRAGLRLHGGMRKVWHLIVRMYESRSLIQCSFHITYTSTDRNIFGVETVPEGIPQRFRRQLSRLPKVPDDGQSQARPVSLPPRVRQNGNRCPLNRQHVTHAGHPHSLRSIEAHQPPPECRTS